MIKQFLQISFIVIVLLIVGELITMMTITSPEASVPDEQLGWLLAPNTRVFNTKEGWASNTTNSLGFNDTEIQPEKTYHVLVLGDSFTEALQVPRQENFTSVIEQSITSSDIINTGRADLSPLQYPVMARRMLREFQPDQIVMILSASDIDDILFNQAEIIRGNNGDITAINLNEKKMHWLRKLASSVFSHSALATFLKERLKAFAHSRKNANVVEIEDRTIQEKKQISSELLNILKFVFSDVKNIAPLSILFIPELDYLPAGKSLEKRKSRDFSALVSKVAMDNNIPFVSASKSMADSYKINVRPPVGFPNKSMFEGHLNPFGHRVIASELISLLKLSCH